MKVIIDTNIYLNFYRLNGGQSLEMLKNLNNFIKNNKFQLILPKQIEDEFIRNKNSNNIYGDHILNFQKGLEVTLKTPYLLNFSPKINQIKNTVKKLNSLKDDAVKDYKNRVFNPKSKINQLINKLFTNAIRPTESDLLLQKAYFRTLRGNPPRKDNSSFGDAIIWETILEQYTNDDLIIISGDGDFESQIKKGEIDELLSLEWSSKTKKKIILYKELGSFINKQSENKKEPPIKKDTIEEEGVLNSVFVNTPTFSIGGENVICGNNLNNAVYKSRGALFGTYGINNCVCCGAEIDSLVFSSDFMFGGNRCENCKDLYTVGQTCSKCGRHFHRSITNYRIGIFDSSYCDECKNNFIN